MARARRLRSTRTASTDGQQVHHEDERLVRTDGSSRALFAVGEVRWDRDSPATTDTHPGDSLIPTLDHLTGTEVEAEGVAAVPRRVELLARLPRHPDVVDF